jgi:hypothetical protein
MAGMLKFLPGTGRGTEPRSGLVEGARGTGFLSSWAPSTKSQGDLVPLPVPGRI